MAALLHPGGSPRVIEAAKVEVDVATTPCALVKTIVVTVGAGVIAGKDVISPIFCPKIGLYVLVARADVTIPPVEALIEELKPYDGVEKVGVGRREFGSVVATVADTDDRKAATAVAATSSVALFKA